MWSDKTKVILNSTQFKLKLKLELSLAIGAVQDTCAFARTGLTNNPSPGHVKRLARIRAYRYLEAKKSG